MNINFTNERYDALICDSEIANRIRLKTATTAVPRFGRIGHCGSLAEATEAMAGQLSFNVVFISNRIPQEEITDFIKKGRGSPQGQDAAYIVVLAGSAQDSSTVAENVMVGADGFLFEPYSVESLTEITALAAKVKRDRTRSREAAALSLVLGDVMSQVDLIAQLKASGLDLGPNLKKFREMCAIFKSLGKDSFENYTVIAIDKFENAQVPMIGKKNYGGVSDRVKKRMEEKAKLELAKRAGVPSE
ncbi:MAG: hypothetical protein RL417_2228 [Pseudomonadota bacterium]|jgi:DNA-binding NarL/FixJ family response regulator